MLKMFKRQPGFCYFEQCVNNKNTINTITLKLSRKRYVKLLGAVLIQISLS